MNSVMNHALGWCRINRSTCWPTIQSATTVPRTPHTWKQDNTEPKHVSYTYLHYWMAILPIWYLPEWFRQFISWNPVSLSTCARDTAKYRASMAMQWDSAEITSPQIIHVNNRGGGLIYIGVVCDLTKRTWLMIAQQAEITGTTSVLLCLFEKAQ